MSASVLLDTHIALWLDSGSGRLKRTTRDHIDQCWHDGGHVFLSAVSVWEIALLVDMHRVVLDLPVVDWVQRFVQRPGVAATPLDHAAAAGAYSLSPFPHRDPADRLLIASAIALRSRFITYDRHILAFAKRYGARHGFIAGSS